MYQISLPSFVWTLSAAVDLVGVTDSQHERRVAFYVLEMFKKSKRPFAWTEEDVIIASMLHDCGVSSTEVHERLIQEMEWNCAMGHCEKGAELLSQTPLLAHLSETVRRHHTRWSHYDRYVGYGASEWLGNLIFLADRLDVLIANQVDDILFTKPKILEYLSSCANILFDPEHVRVCLECARKDIFWLIRDAHSLREYFADWLDGSGVKEVQDQDVLGLFELFGQCVDAKSHFTSDHSKSVAMIAHQLALWMNLDPEHAFRIQLAGLVHDIGKLKVPDQILSKPDALDSLEFSTVKHHSFDAYEILRELRGFHDVAKWASLHHEKLDGSGYPYALKEDEIPLEARILAVADIFQALAQNRPYRKSLSTSQILEIMSPMEEQGQLDVQVMYALKHHLEECMHIAHMEFGS